MRNLRVRFPTWAMWLCGAITLLAGVLLLFAIVLGVQAGQQQLEIKRRQQIGSALQRGIEYHAQGQLAAAQAAYEEVLVLDSNNSAALEGLTHIRQLATLTNTVSMTMTGATTLVPRPTAVLLPAETSLPALPMALPAVEVDQLMQQAEAAYAAGRWSESISLLLKIRQIAATYETAHVDELLFTAYINLATEKDNQDKLEEALSLYDQALALQPDAVEIRQERQLIAEYLDVVTYSGVSWERSTEMLRTLYNEEPDYRDIRERFHEALLTYGEERAADRAWCDSSTLLTEAINIAVTSGIVAQRDEYQMTCAQVGNEPPPLDAASLGVTGTISTELGLAPTGDLPVILGDASGLLSRGRILYSATDVTTGRNRIMQQAVGSASPATVVREDAAQPAMRQDGQRLVFRNTRNDMAGISAWDAGTDLSLQFTGYTEDSQPGWSADSNRVVFASNREGDRIWRIYATWADGNSESVTLSIGESPDWHPAQDTIVFRGCDDSGNGCGLWTMNGAGGNRAPLTTVASDNRPAWSPDGRYVVFMSDGRDGNFEIYRVDTATAQVLRLTNSPTLDGLPTVSPDGRSVAFVSNRDGGWKLWAVPLGGGTETVIAPLSGNLDNWLNQGMQWIP